MFQPSVFREDRREVLHDLITSNPFATLFASAAGALSADHIPLVLHPDLSPHGTLRGHVAVANPLHRETSGDFDVLVVFQGPQAYVTPSWYPSKQEHGKVVPTWNYVVAHAHGRLQFRDDPDWLMAHLEALTRMQEDGRPTPWAPSDAPDDFMARQLRALVGIEIEIEKLTGTWKVSQNKDVVDRNGVVNGLASENTRLAADVADLVKAAKTE